MTSPFASRLDAARDRIYAAVGDTAAALYFAPDGTKLENVSVRVHRQAAHAVPGKVSGFASEVMTATLFVQSSQFVSAPRKGGRFQVGAEVWTIEATPALTNLQWMCPCRRAGLERVANAKADA